MTTPRAGAANGLPGTSPLNDFISQYQPETRTTWTNPQKWTERDTTLRLLNAVAALPCDVCLHLLADHRDRCPNCQSAGAFITPDGTLRCKGCGTPTRRDCSLSIEQAPCGCSE